MLPMLSISLPLYVTHVINSLNYIILSLTHNVTHNSLLPIYYKLIISLMLLALYLA